MSGLLPSSSPVTSVPSSLPKTPSSNEIFGHPEVQDVNEIIENSAHGGGGGGLFFIQGGGFALCQDLTVLGQDEHPVVQIDERNPIGENSVHGGGGLVFLEGGGFAVVQNVTAVLGQDVYLIEKQINPNVENLVLGGGLVFMEGGGFVIVHQDMPVLGVQEVQNVDGTADTNPIPNAVNGDEAVVLQPQQNPGLQRWLQKKKEQREQKKEEKIAKQYENDAKAKIKDYEYDLFCFENQHLLNHASTPSSEDDPVPATACNICPRVNFMSVEARRKHQSVHKGYNAECKNRDCGCIFRSDRIEESHRERRH